MVGIEFAASLNPVLMLELVLRLVSNEHYHTAPLAREVRLVKITH